MESIAVFVAHHPVMVVADTLDDSQTEAIAFLT
jgi:hypothetical protein